MPRVFLSHASEDRREAQRLRRFLTDHGISVWFSEHQLQGADQWQDEIGRALARCTWFVVFLSPHAVKSMWVRREVEYALTEERYDGRIVPLLFKECDVRALSWVLPQLQMIDFTQGYRHAGEKLLRVWGKRLRRSNGKRKRPPRGD